MNSSFIISEVKKYAISSQFLSLFVFYICVSQI